MNVSLPLTAGRLIDMKPEPLSKVMVEVRIRMTPHHHDNNNNKTGVTPSPVDVAGNTVAGDRSVIDLKMTVSADYHLCYVHKLLTTPLVTTPRMAIPLVTIPLVAILLVALTHMAQ